MNSMYNPKLVRVQHSPEYIIYNKIFNINLFTWCRIAH